MNRAGLDLRRGSLPGDGAALFAEVAGRWEAAARQAARPRFRPVGVAEAARAAEGLARPAGPDLRLEYPVAGPGPAGTLIAGYADLVAVTGDRVDVLDFKTDPPPPGPVEAAYPEYVRQVRLYAELLAAAGLPSGRRLRCGLLFTGGSSGRSRQRDHVGGRFPIGARALRAPRTPGDFTAQG
ncbi:MAG TPA: PD-(D/E)XK nuclease family protein [Dehalococcoidia bacterium]|nr:PD-(D/E)XK nuclease family protein [Dehalococcoidia bacterium]